MCSYLKRSSDSEMLYLVESLPKRCLANQFLRQGPYYGNIVSFLESNIMDCNNLCLFGFKLKKFFKKNIEWPLIPKNRKNIFALCNI